MKLTIIETPRPTKTFGELKPGDVFRWNQFIYQRVATSARQNAILLPAGNAVEFDCGETRVEPLDAELIVRPLQQQGRRAEGEM